MSDTQIFMDLMLKRRSNYNLDGTSPISKSEIQEIITHAVLHVPSSFNAQSTRVILLLGKEHKALWDIVEDTLSDIVPGQAFATTKKKLNAFRGAHGTILFFEDQVSIQEYQQKFSLYADRFPVWASESSGMHVFAIWTMLASQGLGANLQHYNPLIDKHVAKRWGVSKEWKLTAQLVFGNPTAEPGVKTFKSVEERFWTLE